MVNLFFVPSLKTITLNRLCINVCCKRAIFSTIQSKPNFQGNEIIDRWISSKIIDWWITRTRPTVDHIIDKFEMPVSLKQEVSENIMKIGVEIHYWKFANSGSPIYDFLLEHFHLVCWNNFGEIDKRQTVKKLVEFYLLHRSSLTNLSPWLLLFLACYYCIEDTICILFFSCLHQFNTPPEHFPGVVKSPLTLYWLNKLVGDTDHYPFLQLYYQAIFSLNLPAIEYFFRHLSVEEKAKSFHTVRKFISTLPPTLDCNKEPYPASVVVFLISNLTAIEQKEIFQNFHSGILCFFLNSSYRISFLKVFDILFEYMTETDLFQILISVASNPDETCFRYSEIFTTIFETCSVESRKVLVKKILNTHTNTFSVLSSLVKNNFVKCIHCLLLFASSKQRYKIKEIITKLTGSRRLKDIKVH